jgi:hypothetical protein
MKILRFSQVMKIRGVNPYLDVGAAHARALKPDWRKPLPVLVRINGKPDKPWRTNLMPAGDGSFYLYLHGDMREASASRVGDRVRAEVQLDDQYRNGPLHPVPIWFRRALRAQSRAAASWQALIPSRKKEILRYFAGLKSKEAKQRNLDRAVHVLSGEPGRFMGRSWKDGK